MPYNASLYQEAIENIRSRSQGVASQPRYDLTINFHPDRLTADSTPLLAAIAQDLRIKSQFETGTSNGGLSANGGERWRWEQRVFGGVYDHALNTQRPKYGALNYQCLDVGASPRFGSAHFRLRPHMHQRATFCYPDSYFEPEHFASSDYTQHLIERAEKDQHDALDAYIEAHFHGDIDLATDVEALVLDPIFRNTEVEILARRLPINLEWHSGFKLCVTELSERTDYRGEKYVSLAKDIAKNQILTPDLLGIALQNGGYEEQDVKKVWHYLARFGYQHWSCG
ncbi:DUF3626 domain-containing protein [Vibrio sp. WXL103]|uniref:DUF3626 domain-containing protein n=1 Tax=Vibrio sp. WXL103 TaxID=3450710 RepID=UPI003EC8333E